MVDLGTVQLLCNTSEKGGGGKQKYDFVLHGGKRGGVLRGAKLYYIIIEWPLIGRIY